MRLSMSRHAPSSLSARAPASRRMPSTAARAPARRARLCCRRPALSRMRLRMPNNSTAAAPPIASAAPPQLIDIGVNLAHDSYDADRDAVITRARHAGVIQMLVTGSTLASSNAAIALARAHPGQLFATAGVHPHHAHELSAPAILELEQLARGAAAGLPSPARAGRSHRQAGVPAPARRPC